ncbi:MAG: DUF4349 domain-containing protein [Candidatus Moranbacteria bacterium]|nr:DUF4349 domain-containing protein [Candidatus Moranbacteria bacterium]
MKKVLTIGGIIIAVIIVLCFAVSLMNPMGNVISDNLSTTDNAITPGLATPAPSGMALKSSGAGDTSAAPEEQALPSVEKKIIKSGNLNLQVEKVDTASDKISKIAKDNGGDVFSSNIRQSKSNVKSGTITAKVPVANFEKAFGDLKKIAILVINESTTGQDVTEQYTDLQAQLKNAQAEEQTFLKILNQAGKMDDVLAVTREVARVRGVIERIQGQVKYLASQTDMSTITISLTEDTNITVIDSWRPVQVIKEAFNSLVKSLQGLINFLIRLIIIVIPVLIVWALIIFIFYKIGKKVYLKIKGQQ